MEILKGKGVNDLPGTLWEMSNAKPEEVASFLGISVEEITAVQAAVKEVFPTAASQEDALANLEEYFTPATPAAPAAPVSPVWMKTAPTAPIAPATPQFSPEDLRGLNDIDLLMKIMEIMQEVIERRQFRFDVYGVESRKRANNFMARVRQSQEVVSLEDLGEMVDGAYQGIEVSLEKNRILRQALKTKVPDKVYGLLKRTLGRKDFEDEFDSMCAFMAQVSKLNWDEETQFNILQKGMFLGDMPGAYHYVTGREAEADFATLVAPATTPPPAAAPVQPATTAVERAMPPWMKTGK